MNCNEIEERLADYLGGELGGEERVRFEEHLAVCLTCRREAESLGGTLETLRDLPPVDPAEANRRASVLEIRRRPAGLRGIVWRALPYAACVVVGVCAGVLSPRPTVAGGPTSAAMTGIGPVVPSVPTVEGTAGGIHPMWVAAARESQALQDTAAPIASSFALLAEISSRERGGKK